MHLSFWSAPVARACGCAEVATWLGGYRASRRGGTHAAGKEGEKEPASPFRQKEGIAIGIELDG
jgi:hypothetical protein